MWRDVRFSRLSHYCGTAISVDEPRLCRRSMDGPRLNASMLSAYLIIEQIAAKLGTRLFPFSVNPIELVLFSGTQWTIS